MITKEQLHIYEQDIKETSSDDIHNDAHNWRAVFKTLAVIIFSIIMVVLLMYLYDIKVYYKCLSLMNTGEYDLAVEKLETISYFKDANELLDECSYLKAKQLLDLTQPYSALNILRDMEYYKDSEELIKECEYLIALNHKTGDVIESDISEEAWGDLFRAYELFEKLEDYKDSPCQLLEVKQAIYDKGIELYHEEKYSEASEHFSKSQDCGREDDYLTLIDVHTSEGGTDDISILYDLIGFEDTNDILLSTEYIEDFMLGRWSDYSGNYVEYYKEDDESTTWTVYNLPSTDGEHYKLEEGAHLKWNNEYGYLTQWTYTIVTANKVQAYCYIDGRTYTLYRN